MSTAELSQLHRVDGIVDVGPRKVIGRTFESIGLADALRAAAECVIENGQFGIWDVTTESNAETGRWTVTVYMAMRVEPDAAERDGAA